MIQKVNIVYHVAASVRFDDRLGDAIKMNTRGTRDVVTLTKDMVNLEVFIHFSTTYCNIHIPFVEEKLYPCPADWKASINLAEKADQNLLDTLTPKYLDYFPNTYTFTKSMAEHVVKDMCEGRIPTVVFRPSIGKKTLGIPPLICLSH